MTPHICFGVKPEQPRVCNVFLRSQTKSNRRVNSPQREYEARLTVRLLSQWRRDFPVSDVVGLGAHVGVRRFSAMLFPRGAVGAVFGKRLSDVVALDETVMTARVSVVARLFLVAKLVCHTKHVKITHSQRSRIVCYQLTELTKPHTGTNFILAMSKNTACQVVTFHWREVCQDGKVTHSLCHVVPYATHKLRTVHEMRDSQCHACALDNIVVTSRDTLVINFWTFQNFRHDMARTTSPDPHRHAFLRISKYTFNPH